MCILCFIRMFLSQQINIVPGGKLECTVARNAKVIEYLFIKSDYILLIILNANIPSQNACFNGI